MGVHPSFESPSGTTYLVVAGASDATDAETLSINLGPYGFTNAPRMTITITTSDSSLPMPAYSIRQLTSVVVEISFSYPFTGTVHFHAAEVVPP